MRVDPFLCKECYEGQDALDTEASISLDTEIKGRKEIKDYDSEGDSSKDSSYKPSEKPKAKREKDIIKKKYKEGKETVRKKHEESKEKTEMSIGTRNTVKGGRRILKALRKSAEKPKDVDYKKERLIDNDN